MRVVVVLPEPHVCGGLAPRPRLFVWWCGSKYTTSCVVFLASKQPLVAWWFGSQHTTLFVAWEREHCAGLADICCFCLFV